MKTLLHFYFAILVFLFSLAAGASPAGLTLQGRLVKNDVAVVGAVQLRVRVTSPNSAACILYEEEHNLTLASGDSGSFSVVIGSGNRTLSDKGLSVTDVFKNDSVQITGLTCPGGGSTYTPGPTHSRHVWITFINGPDTVAFATPYVTQSVPYAFDSDRLNGKSSSEFIQTNADTTQSKIDNLMDSTNYSAITDLIAGNSTAYFSPSSAISTSANFTQTGSTTFSTGTGAVSINGPTTIAANQNLSMSSGTGTFSQTYTGTGTANSLTANSVTTSPAQSITANGLTSGSILSLSSNSTTAAAGNKGLDIAISGANGTSSISRTGVSSVVTSTGTTSTNIGGYFSASGATNNYGLIVGSGNVGIGISNPAYSLDVSGTIQGYGYLLNGSINGVYSPSAAVATPSGNYYYANNSANTDGVLSGLRMLTTNSSSNYQRAYIGAVSTTGAGVYTPSIVVGQQTAAAAYTERMRIDELGNIGIGTATPTGLLDVRGGTAASATNGTNISLYAQAAGAGNQNGGHIVLMPGSKTGTGTAGSVLIGASSPPYAMNANSLYVSGVVYSTYLQAGNNFTLGDSTKWVGHGGNASTGYMIFATDSAERVRINATGNVGIGATNPGRKLEVSSTATSNTLFTSSGVETNVRISNTSTGGRNFELISGGSGGTFSGGKFGIYDQTSSAARFTIDSTGNTGIGTASPTTKLDVSGTVNATAFTINGTPVGTSTSSYWNQTGSDIYFSTGRVAIGTGSIPAWVGANALYTPGTMYANMLQASTNLVFGEGSKSIANGGSGATGYMTFLTNTTERARIDGSGNMGIGTTGPNYKLDVAGDINTSTCFRIGATIVSGTCASDERLKENVSDYKSGLSELLKVKLHTYTFNGLGEMPKTGEVAVGVIAQELEKTNPELVKTRLVKMRPEDQEKTEIKTVDYSKFSYMLINAVKELYQKWFTDHETLQTHDSDLQSLKAVNLQLKSQVRSLASENETHKQEIETLKNDNARFKAYLCEKDPSADFCR